MLKILSGKRMGRGGCHPRQLWHGKHQELPQHVQTDHDCRKHSDAFWPQNIANILNASMRVHSATSCQQPPEWLVLSQTNCFNPCRFVGLGRSEPFSSTEWEVIPEVSSRWWHHKDLLDTHAVVCMGDVSEQGQMPRPDDFIECTLIRSALYFITGDEVVPFNSNDQWPPGTQLFAERAPLATLHPWIVSWRLWGHFCQNI